MKIINRTKSSVIADRVRIADTFISRMVGLLNRTSLEQGEALVITRCNSIHMFFMKFPIDVLFVSKEDRVVGLLKNIPPNRLSRIFFKASYAIELPAGTIDRTETRLQDRIELDKR